MDTKDTRYHCRLSSVLDARGCKSSTIPQSRSKLKSLRHFLFLIVCQRSQSGSCCPSAMASRSSVPSEVTGYECPSPGPGMRSNSASATQRPSSGMTRGVQIVEYTDSALERLNPHPVTAMNDESTVLLEEYLCPRKLVGFFLASL